jgi:hypothetical protein
MTIPSIIQVTTKGQAICAYCGVGCRLWMESVNGALIRVRGVSDAPANLGGICAKGATLPEVIHTLNQSTVGTWKNNSLINLHLLTGQIGKPGAGPFSMTGQPNAMGGRQARAVGVRRGPPRRRGRGRPRRGAVGRAQHPSRPDPPPGQDQPGIVTRRRLRPVSLGRPAGRGLGGELLVDPGDRSDLQAARIQVLRRPAGPGPRRAGGGAELRAHQTIGGPRGSHRGPHAIAVLNPSCERPHGPPGIPPRRAPADALLCIPLLRHKLHGSLAISARSRSSRPGPWPLCARSPDR